VTGAARRQAPDPTEESITDRLSTIGSVAGDGEHGFRAYDENGDLIEVFETRPAARRAVFLRYRSEDRQ